MASGDPRSDMPTWLTGMAIGIVLIFVVVFAYQLGSSRGEKKANEANASKYANPKFIKIAGVKVDSSAGATGGAAEKPKAAPKGPGLDDFKTTCGGCHTLAAAGTKGATGPNLDAVKPDEATVLKAIKDGGLTGTTMPKNLLTGKKAEETAKFVGDYAGQQ